MRNGIYRKYIKRLLGFVISAVLIVLLLPLFAVLSLIIALSERPVFFRQKRVGIHRTYFMIMKFRTMKTSTPENTPTHLLKNPEQYITGIGKILRKTSMDEIPQLFNIFAGDMAFVGPRPALWNQYDLLDERDKYGANDIMPGLTGWAQINGRDALEISEKARLDGVYVQKCSFLFDCRCFFRTFVRAFKGEGVVEGGTGGK